MNQGFSGRGLDQRVVTPFLRKNKFPYMQAGSGWLTRSLEQKHPYTYDYPGVITPPNLKEAFLRVVNLVEEQKISAKACLAYILHKLIVWREKNASITLSNLLLDIRRNYGCQVIVNGVSCTIRYYLRLLLDIDMFLYKYVSLVEADKELVFDLKIKWNEIVDGIG